MDAAAMLTRAGFDEVIVLSGAECGVKEATLLIAVRAYEAEDAPEGGAWIHPYYFASQQAYLAAQETVQLARQVGVPLSSRDEVRVKPIFARLPRFQQGRNTLSYLPGIGSRFHVQIFTLDAPLPPTEHLLPEAKPLQCGDCRRCLDACPTGALDEAGFHREKCLRNWQLSGKAVPEALRVRMGNRLIGCDSCQRCCPHNPPPVKRGEPVPLQPLLTDIRTSAAALSKQIGANLAIPNRVLAQACLIAGCSGDVQWLDALDALRTHPSPAVAEHARWASQRLKNEKGKEMISMEKAKVYFTKEITSESLLKIYHALGQPLTGRVAVKLSTGEPGGHNFLNPRLIAPLVSEVKGTIVECNTAYEGRRNTSEEHWKAIREHGFLDIAPCDIMDEDGEMALPVRGENTHLSENMVGAHLKNYDSMMLLSHFKGHAMGGFGGALKNMSIGVASSHGKALIHGVGDPEKIWTADHDSFLECMAEADRSVVDYMKPENLCYINVANRLSVDCDCDSHPKEPEMGDIGIFASLDPVAVDQACYDAVMNSEDPGKAALIERMTSRNAIHTVERAAELGVGVRDYELISLD